MRSALRSESRADVTASRAYVNARITPAILPEPWYQAAMTCPGDGCRCKRGDPIHPPLLMTFEPGQGEYRETQRATCSAVWATSTEGRDRGRHCGEPATHQVADVFLCGPHYRRMREWMNTRDQRDEAAAARTAQRIHENQMRLDRDRSEAQREDDRITAAQRAGLLRQEAKLQRELDRERVRAEEAARAEASRVYFVRRESDGLIKIGTSRTLAARMVSLKRDHGALQMLAATGGAHREETAMHRQFAELRVEGEWFRPELPLLEHVYTLMKECPLDPAPGLPPIAELRQISGAIYRMKMVRADERRRQRQEEEQRLQRQQTREARKARAAGAAEPAVIDPGRDRVAVVPYI